MRNRSMVRGFLLLMGLTLMAGWQAVARSDEKGTAKEIVRFVEIVCTDVDEQVAALESVHGLSFGDPMPELGTSRVAVAPDGTMFGVRRPLAEHEQPIVRTYLRVEDIAQAVADAQAAGAMLAYPPTAHGKTGTYAIYILGGVQMGLWQP